MDYYFGDGEGSITGWNSVPDVDLDGDYLMDAVSLDFDGDGCTDDAMWDRDGDGHAEISALDLDDDGVVDSFYSDRAGRGIWAEELAEPYTRMCWLGNDFGVQCSFGVSPERVVDLDSDGARDDKVWDTNGDQLADLAYVAFATAQDSVYVDTDKNGTWDIMLRDSDMDGTADASYDANDSDFWP
ncbi:MAG: pullulanase [Mycobacteriaceae bacterium]